MTAKVLKKGMYATARLDAILNFMRMKTIEAVRTVFKMTRTIKF